MAYTFTNVSTDYTVRGEFCYGANGYVSGYPVSGEMRSSLTVVSDSTVSFTFVHILTHAETGVEFEHDTKSGEIIDHLEPDGNDTLLFISFPLSKTQPLSTLSHTITAYYHGVRYVNLNGIHVPTHYFCIALADLQTVLRFEWYFEWNSGILLQFCKIIEQNLVRVQWLEYKVANTTLSLSGAHPVTAFFANIQEWFYGSLGAGIITIVLFHYLIQKKIQQEASI